MIAPDVKPLEVFQGVLGDILRAQLERANGLPQWLQIANESYTGSRALPEQLRSVKTMVTNGQFVLKVRRDDQPGRDARARALRRTLLAIGALICCDRRITRPPLTGRQTSSYREKRNVLWRLDTID